MDDEETIHFRKRTDKTYVSPSISVYGAVGRRIRIASKVIDSAAGYKHATERGELVLRVTSGGRQEIVAKFYEDDRGIFVLTFQRYRSDTGGPYERTHFSFTGDEINKLLEFIVNLKRLSFPSDEKINVTDDDLREIILSNDQVRRVALDNQELIVAIATNEITKNDIVALGYRREQLKRYYRLLTDRAFFDATVAELNATPEKVWQLFFESNRWIFGYGLSFVFLSGLDAKKLEQIVAGYSLKDIGKRSDGVLKTRGLISSLCFVEIKHHMTALLEFQTEHGINEAKYRSFELYRRNVDAPEIITFDELYHRAKFIVEHQE